MGIEKVKGLILLKRKNEMWEMCLSFYVSFNLAFLYLGYRIFKGTPLNTFKDRIIGITSLNGIDPNQRTVIFLVSVFIFSFSYLVCTNLLKVLNNYAISLNKALIPDGGKNRIILLVTVAITNEIIFIYNNLNGKQAAVGPSAILFCILAFVLIIAVVTTVANPNKPVLHDLVSDKGITVSSFIIPVSLIAVIQLATESPIHFSNGYLILFFILQFTYYVIWYFLLKWYQRRKQSTESIKRKQILSLLPFSLIPCSIPLANEIQFSISTVSALSPYAISIAIIAILCLFSLIPAFLHHREKSEIFTDNTIIIHRYLFPIVIATCALYTYHQHFLVFSSFDMFHFAENILPIQEIIRFNQIPYIDFILPHGLYDIFPQFFYVFLNGYRSLEVLIWGGFCVFYEVMLGWGIVVFGSILIYFLLSELIDHQFSLLVILFLPVGMIFSNYYAVLIIPVLFLVLTIENPTFKNLLILWFLLVFIFLWRVDFGIACIAVTLFMLFFSEINKKWANLNSILLSFSIIIIPLLIFFYLLILFNDKSFTGVLEQIYYYFKLQVTALSYNGIYKKFSSLVIFQYLIIPALCVFYIIYYISDRLFSEKEPDRKLQILTSFAIICLIFSIRSLHRHSLIERYSPYLFVLLFCCLPVIFKVLEKRHLRISFLFLFLTYYFIFPNYFGKSSVIWGRIESSLPKNHYLGTIPTKIDFEFKKWENKESRVIIKNRSQYQNIVKFLDSYLENGQTFIDFSNSTMLYVFSERKYPFFITENLYHTSEIIQKNNIERLKAMRNANQIPLVVFKQGNQWDNIDGVPNEIRSYRMAEWIYGHYRPFGKVDNYSIWVEKEDQKSPLDYTEETDFDFFIPSQGNLSQNFDLKKLPHIWANFDELDPVGHSKVLYTYKPVRKTLISPSKPLILSFKPIKSKKLGNYLHLRLKAERQTTIKIEYRKNNDKNGSSFEMSVLPTGKDEDYLIRLSTQWQWYAGKVSSFKITSKNKVDVMTIQILEGD